MNLDLAWIDSREGDPVHTMGRLAVHADDQPVWPAWVDRKGGLEIYGDDLLSYLTEFWQPLMLRQTYPMNVSIERPGQLRPVVERMWRELPEQQVETQEDVISAFEEAYNFARCFGGQFDLPPLWLFRQGSFFLVETSDRTIRTRFQPTVAALAAVGDSIAARLGQRDGGNWDRLLARWRNRGHADPDAQA